MTFEEWFNEDDHDLFNFPEEAMKAAWEQSSRSPDVSLRDHFAMQAMNAIIIGNNADICVMGEGAAKDAYKAADAMMTIRQEPVS